MSDRRHFPTGVILPAAPPAAPAAQDAELIAHDLDWLRQHGIDNIAGRLAALSAENVLLRGQAVDDAAQVAALTRERDNISELHADAMHKVESAEARCATMERDVVALKWLTDTMMSIPTMTDEQLAVLRGEAESIVARAALAEVCPACRCDEGAKGCLNDMFRGKNGAGI
jgi:hypothetical protein